MGVIDMTAVLIVAIVFGSILTFFIVIFAFILALKKIQVGGSMRERGRLNTEETRLIQEIYRGLTKMEERVEALETILLDREKREKERNVTDDA
jgi:phage shock protein B